ncbi:MAG: coenzyme F420-0:L-glutamate ligase [Clostridia bacterium]|nr:coenzyme F420-0:L-glutamate ligase [Clostridia bacterium]
MNNDQKFVNPGKNQTVTVDGIEYRRLCIKTHVITIDDNIVDVAEKYAKPLAEAGDTLVISEKAVACTQGRAIPLVDIKPRKLAVFLSKHVTKTPVGIGLGMPETMEMALRECGTPRILFAAAVSVIGKLLGKSGWFYIVAGDRARSIDGPCHYTLPPYNKYVVLGPKEPARTAKEIADRIGINVAIIDANDLGCVILGSSKGSPSNDTLCKILKDNPLGQTNEQTPMGIIRVQK